MRSHAKQIPLASRAALPSNMMRPLSLADLQVYPDFSKIEAGKPEIAPAPFRIAQIMESACSTFLAGAFEKGIGLAWEIAKDVPEWLECDSGRIRQVLLNVMGNALKFTEQGEIRVSATSRYVEDDTIELNITVSDTGIGIPAHARSLIFEAFRQADGSTDRTYGGTGLGLTISSRLAHLMGGTISVESEIGSGSVFRFQVNAQRVAAPPECAALEVSGSEQTIASRRLHILLAEDNTVNQRVATALLSRARQEARCRARRRRSRCSIWAFGM